MSKDILYPLRRLHGMLHEWNLERKRLKAVRRYVTAPKGKKVYIIGLPEHTNLGDSAIAMVQEKFLRAYIPADAQIKTVSFPDYERDRNAIRRRIPAGSLVTQLGGGNMGSQWLNEEYFRRNVLGDLPDSPMVIFPQTIYYGQAEQDRKEEQASVPIYNDRAGLTITAREQRSFEIMKSLYPKAEILLVPDIVLWADMATFGVKPTKRDGILLCLRSDAERALSDEERESLLRAANRTGMRVTLTDMHSNCWITQENRAGKVREKMEEFASAKLVITDRLHGMIFAALTGTPCIVLGNYNHKVQGTYDWISYLPYIRYARSAGEVEQLMPDLLKMENCVYDKTPLLPYYEKLVQVVKSYASDQRDRSGL